MRDLEVSLQEFGEFVLKAGLVRKSSDSVIQKAQ
jgi:hypothetical protein